MSVILSCGGAGGGGRGELGFGKMIVKSFIMFSRKIIIFTFCVKPFTFSDHLNEHYILSV